MEGCGIFQINTMFTFKRWAKNMRSMRKKNEQHQEWFPYIQRYMSGEWRATIFRDMVLADVERLEQRNGKLTLMDIGCGGGFDNNAKLQRSISQVAEQYIGIEPDTDIELQDIFTSAHRCFFEDSSIDPESIDLAFAVMVIEHFENPKRFWDKVHSTLKKGGVFWGFTVDARHWFVFASFLAEKLAIKDWYLDRLHGKRGEERYENYGVFYRSNTPQQIKKLTSAFTSSVILDFYRVGQMDYYLPDKLRWLGRAYDRVAIRMGWPGSIMAMRVQK